MTCAIARLAPSIVVGRRGRLSGQGCRRLGLRNRLLPGRMARQVLIPSVVSWGSALNPQSLLASPKRSVQVRGRSGLDLHSGRPNADPPLTGQDRRDVDHADHPSASSKPAAPHHQEPWRSWAGTRTKGLNGPKVAGRRFNDEPLRSHEPRWELRSRFHQIVLIRRETSHSDRHARSLLKMKTWVSSLPHHGRPVICWTSERPATLQPRMLGFTPDPAAAAGGHSSKERGSSLSLQELKR
jgi:hypothetical protein